MSEIIEDQQLSQILAPGEGEEFLFELGNLRHLVELPVGPRHQPLGDKGAEPGGTEETELSVEPGGGETALQVEITQLLGQTSLVAAVQRPKQTQLDREQSQQVSRTSPIIFLEVQMTEENCKYGDQFSDLRQLVVSF